MITLKDVLKLNYTITLISLDIRNTDGRLIKHVYIGKGYKPTVHQLSDDARGLFEYIDADINIHGRADRRGISEMAYNIDFKAIPKRYLDMEVDMVNSLTTRSGTNNGMTLWATVVPVQIGMDCPWE